MVCKQSKVTFAGVVAAALSVPISAQAATFDIQVVFEGGLSASQQSIFSVAEAFWETAITGYTTGVSVPALVISAAGVAIDGVGGILGSAGPLFGLVAADVNITYAIEGQMRFDTADLGAAEANGSLLDIIVHEMAHVIGFGTLWNTDSLGGSFAGTQALYVSGSGQFTGANALATYQTEFDPLATFVPVELDGGPGTANGHWDEVWGGGPNEIMTGFLNLPTFVSDTTIASFADIGYTVDLSANDISIVPLPAPVLLMGFGLGLLGWAGRRKAAVRA